MHVTAQDNRESGGHCFDYRYRRDSKPNSDVGAREVPREFALSHGGNKEHLILQSLRMDYSTEELHVVRRSTSYEHQLGSETSELWELS